MPAVTFQALCTAMDAAGVEVRVTLGADGRHVIGLADPAPRRGRSLAVPVARGFDAAATMLCCSLALARDVGDTGGEARRLAAAWPELVELAHAASQSLRQR
jgi:hypothetical protein